MRNVFVYILLSCTICWKCFATSFEVNAQHDVASASVMWSATNHWLESQEDFKHCSSSGVLELIRSGTPFAREQLDHWCVYLAELPIPDENSPRTHWYWLELNNYEIGRWADRYTTSNFTNCWLAVAKRMGEIRRRLKVEKEIGERIRENRKRRNTTMKPQDFAIAFANYRCALRKHENRRIALEYADSYLTGILKNEFVQKGISGLSENLRHEVFVKISDAACLSQDETQLLEKQLTTQHSDGRTHLGRIQNGQ